MNRIHHINLVVYDIDAATKHFEVITGIAAEPVERLPDRHVLLRRFRLNDLWLVLVSPTHESSPAAVWLDAHGPGLFLMSFSTDNLDAELARLQRDGITPSGVPRKGLEDWRVVDLDAAAFGGIPVQLTESAITTAQNDLESNDE